MAMKSEEKHQYYFANIHVYTHFKNANTQAKIWPIQRLKNAAFLQKEFQYKRLTQLMTEKITVEGKVTGSNGGGLFVLIDGITGFCPKSLVPTVSCIFTLQTIKRF